MASALQQNPLLGRVSTLTQTQNTLVNTTGTAAAASSGTRTLAAITDAATAADAIEGICDELNLAKADIAALIARVNGTA